MSESVQITLIANQKIRILGVPVNIDEIECLELNDKGEIVWAMYCPPYSEAVILKKKGRKSDAR